MSWKRNLATVKGKSKKLFFLKVANLRFQLSC